MSIKGVIDGQPVNAATTNTAFLAKNGDDSTTHKIGFADTDPSGVSGTAIDNAQRELNAILSALGMSPNQIAAFKLTWASDAVGAANDTVKARIEALVTLIQTKADASTVSTALATKADASAFTAHTGATTSVHGIADTSALVTKTGTQTLSGKTFSDAATFAQIATPANPSTGFNKIYAKADGKFYTLDSSGTETQVGSGAGGGTGGSATIYSYGPTSSTAGQTTIGPLGFSVPVGSRGNFYLSIDGKEMSEGATNDYTWIDSANIQLNTTLVAGLNIKASYIASIPAGTVTTTATPANKNYITYGNFENNATTGWSLGTIGTLTNALPTGTPTFGSGAAGTLGISTVSSGKLAGTFSLQLAASAATVAGNCLASDAYAIDISDQSKVLSFRFNYKLASGTADFSGTKTNSFAVAVWDATNSAFIPVTGAFNLVQSSGVGIAQGTFQTNANTGSIRFIVYCANATSGAVTLLIDDIYVGPQSLAFGPPMSDETATALAPSAGFGTTSLQSAWMSRIGDKARFRGYFKVGTPAAIAASVQLPSGISMDSNKFSTTSQVQMVGWWQTVAAAANANMTAIQRGPVFYDGTDTGNLYFANQSGANVLKKNNGSDIWFAGDGLTYEFIVPVSGWSSNTVLSQDSDTRLVAARVYGATTTISTSDTTITYPSVAYDSHAAYSGSTYTVPVSGKYKVTAYLAGPSLAYTLNTGLSISVYKNGSRYSYLYQGSASGTATYRQNGSGSTEIDCVAGDQLIIKMALPTSAAIDQTTSDLNWATFERLSGPATVAASEKVYLQYTGNAGTALTATTTNVDFSTKVTDSHNAWSGTAFTAPRPGWYDIEGCVQITASTSNNYFIYVNGTLKYFIGMGNIASANKCFSGGTYLNTGDVMSIRSDSGVTLSNSSVSHWIAIRSQG